MKKLLVSLMLLAGVVIGGTATTADAQVIVPVRPCYYAVVPVTVYQLVWTAYGYVYAPVTVYQYQLVCY